jgi:hypothetical protein
MQFTQAALTRLVVLTLGLGLAGCGSIDDALFGSESTAPAAAPPAAQTSEATPSSDTATVASGEAAPTAAPTNGEPGMTLAAIEPGSDTGTPVGKTVQQLRGELSTLHDKVATDLQQFNTLKAASVQDVTTYQEAKSHIVIRLQTGTTKGNPELVNEWNTAQSALDTLTGNINSFAALGTELTPDAGRAHTERDTISDAFNMAGAVDDDHHQLSALQQEANQMVDVLDHLTADVTRNVQRQTAFVANERGGLTRLADDIKNGELYATAEPATTATAAASPAATGTPASAIVTIRFAHAKVDFEQDLYAALNQTLKATPGATFQVVAVSPTRGSATAMQKAQSEAQHHAQDVLKSMTDMGVPAARVAISSSTDPAASATEVRVYAK